MYMRYTIRYWNETVKFILVIHLCYLHSVLFFSGMHLFFVGSPHWNQNPFQTCENPTVRRRGGRRGLIFAKKDTTTIGTHGDIVVSSDDFRGILWHESAYILIFVEYSYLVLMIGWTNAIAITEAPGMPTGSSRWRRSKGSGSGFTFCSDVNIGIATSMGFAEVRHVFYGNPGYIFMLKAVLIAGPDSPHHHSTKTWRQIRVEKRVCRIRFFLCGNSVS